MSYLYAVEMFIPSYPFRPVKIGFSIVPETRVRAFSGGPFPTLCLGYWEAPNGRMDEVDAHAKFHKFRLYGEWFYPAPEVLTFIENSLNKSVSETPTGLSTKMLRFESRFRGMFQRPLEHGIDEVASSPAALPDPFDCPFPPPHADRVDTVMRWIAERWPVRGDWEPSRQLITTKELSAITGLDPKIVREKVTRIQCLGTVRYKLSHVREFLMDFPMYIERIAAKVQKTSGLEIV